VRVLRAPTCTMDKVIITKIITNLTTATGLGATISWTVITVYFGITAGTLILTIEVITYIHIHRKINIFIG
jgi:hypothetical protein